MQAGLTRQLRDFALWAVGPFLLLSLISPGVMPARGADGALVLVLCTADGMVETAVDPVTLEPLTAPDGGPGQHPQNARDHCPWVSLHGLAMQAVAAPMPVRGGDITPLMIWPLAETVLQAGRVTGLPPSTGPPAIV